MNEPNSLTAEERAQGYVLACVARPLSATTVTIDVEEVEGEELAAQRQQGLL